MGCRFVIEFTSEYMHHFKKAAFLYFYSFINSFIVVLVVAVVVVVVVVVSVGMRE